MGAHQKISAEHGLGGGLVHTLLSPHCPFHVWKLQHVEIIHMFLIYIISFMA